MDRKFLNCRGSWILGTACGECGSCIVEKSRLKALGYVEDPDNPKKMIKKEKIDENKEKESKGCKGCGYFHYIVFGTTSKLNNVTEDGCLYNEFNVNVSLDKITAKYCPICGGALSQGSLIKIKGDFK